MNRRDFLWRALELSAAGLLVPPFLRKGTALGLDRSLAMAAGLASSSDSPYGGRVLVLINLEGGNDGLNMVIPRTDPTYYQIRPTIAIPPGQVIPISPTLGLHPALSPVSSLYNSGKMAVLQSVGYPQMDLSHFRGTDIWFSGSGSDSYVETGWLARFLETTFPAFPMLLPEAPYGIQQAYGHRIPLQGERGQTGVVVDNPYSFYSLVIDSYAGTWEDEPPATRGGEELNFVRRIDRETFQYAEAIQAAAKAGTNTVEYPDSHLSLQLEVVARLLSGGLETPMFLTAIGGFDTHTDQAPWHGEILGYLAEAVALFLTDLTNQGLDDRVLVVTTSEFGRRPEENGGFGTDHGTGAAHFAFGSPVQGGIYGSNPNLNDLDQDGNLLVEQDFRSVYSTVMQDFFGASPAVAEDVLAGNFARIPFIQDIATDVGRRSETTLVNRLHGVQPNPLSASKLGRAAVRFELASSASVSLAAFDAQGRRVADLASGSYREGRHEVIWNLESLPAGTYYCRLQSEGWEKKSKVTVLP